MADVVVDFEIDDAALWSLVCNGQGTRSLVTQVTSRSASNANSLSAGFRTGLYYVNHKAPPVGNTQPRYESNVQTRKGVPIGIVYTANYAAAKENHLHNTLLKSL